jgi:hypothetical protein
MAVQRCLLCFVLLAAFEALIDDLAHCTLGIRNGNIILMSTGRSNNDVDARHNIIVNYWTIVVLEGGFDYIQVSKVLIKNKG